MIVVLLIETSFTSIYFSSFLNENKFFLTLSPQKNINGSV